VVDVVRLRGNESVKPRTDAAFYTAELGDPSMRRGLIKELERRAAREHAGRKKTALKTSAVYDTGAAPDRVAKTATLPNAAPGRVAKNCDSA
jgi:hypothetical protein